MSYIFPSTTGDDFYAHGSVEELESLVMLAEYAIANAKKKKIVPINIDRIRDTALQLRLTLKQLRR